MAIRKHLDTQAVFVGSVIFVILAIGFTSLLERTGSSESATDTRAKAGITATLKVSAVVNSVDQEKGVILIENLKFLDADSSLGSWTVTPPPGFSITTLFPGTKVTLTVDPTKFMAATHTLTATQIKIER